MSRFLVQAYNPLFAFYKSEFEVQDTLCMCLVMILVLVFLHQLVLIQCIHRVQLLGLH